LGEFGAEAVFGLVGVPVRELLPAVAGHRPLGRDGQAAEQFADVASGGGCRARGTRATLGEQVVDVAVADDGEGDEADGGRDDRAGAARGACEQIVHRETSPRTEEPIWSAVKLN